MHTSGRTLQGLWVFEDSTTFKWSLVVAGILVGAILVGVAMYLWWIYKVGPRSGKNGAATNDQVEEDVLAEVAIGKATPDRDRPADNLPNSTQQRSNAQAPGPRAAPSLPRPPWEQSGHLPPGIVLSSDVVEGFPPVFPPPRPPGDEQAAGPPNTCY